MSSWVPGNGFLKSGGATISSHLAARSPNRKNRAAKGANRELREQPFDFARLERAIRALVERKQQLQSKNAEMHAALEDRDHTIRSLELRIMEGSQRREDALKQLDELIARVAGLEACCEDERG